MMGDPRDIIAAGTLPPFMRRTRRRRGDSGGMPRFVGLPPLTAPLLCPPLRRRAVAVRPAVADQDASFGKDMSGGKVGDRLDTTPELSVTSVASLTRDMVVVKLAKDGLCLSDATDRAKRGDMPGRVFPAAPGARGDSGIKSPESPLCGSEAFSSSPRELSNSPIMAVGSRKTCDAMPAELASEESACSDVADSILNSSLKRCLEPCDSRMPRATSAACSTLCVSKWWSPNSAMAICKRHERAG